MLTNASSRLSVLLSLCSYACLQRLAICTASYVVGRTAPAPPRGAPGSEIGDAAPIECAAEMESVHTHKRDDE